MEYLQKANWYKEMEDLLFTGEGPGEDKKDYVEYFQKTPLEEQYFPNAFGDTTLLNDLEQFAKFQGKDLPKKIGLPKAKETEFLDKSPKKRKGVTEDPVHVAKKEHHNNIEKKRRKKINTELEQLKELNPYCKNVNANKLAVLHFTCEYIQNLQDSYKKLMETNKILKEKNEKLHNEVRDFQKTLLMKDGASIPPVLPDPATPLPPSSSPNMSHGFAPSPPVHPTNTTAFHNSVPITNQASNPIPPQTHGHAERAAPTTPLLPTGSQENQISKALLQVQTFVTQHMLPPQSSSHQPGANSAESTFHAPQTSFPQQLPSNSFLPSKLDFPPEHHHGPSSQYSQCQCSQIHEEPNQNGHYQQFMHPQQTQNHPLPATQPAQYAQYVPSQAQYLQQTQYTQQPTQYLQQPYPQQAYLQKPQFSPQFQHPQYLPHPSANSPAQQNPDTAATKKAPVNPSVPSKRTTWIFTQIPPH